MDDSLRHRKLVRHYHDPGELHELTFSCYKRLPLLADNASRRRLSLAIDAAGRQSGVDLVAFVYMPEHVHLLVTPTLPEAKIGRYLALIKQPFSKWMKEYLREADPTLVERLTVQERPGKRCFRFWQEGPGFDRNLSTAREIEVAIDYLHRNPTRRSLVTRAVEWEWSSARWYLLEPFGQQFADLPFVHGPPTGALNR